MTNNTNTTTSALLAALFADLGKLEARINGTPSSGEIDTIRNLSLRLYNEVSEYNTLLKQYSNEVKSHLTKSSDAVNSIINSAELIAQEHNFISGSSTEGLLPLSSLCARVETDEKKSAPRNKYFYHVPKVLEIDNLLPDSASSINDIPSEQIKTAYTKIYKDFIDELRSIKPVTAELVIGNILYLLEKYLTYIPASTNTEENDVSLFDHIKSVSALTSCLVQTDSEENPFLLVSCDISGIQSFLYSDDNPIENSSRGTSKRLRGKSFYLVLLTESISSYLLREFGLSRANLLMNGGGHFILLVPRNVANMKKLESAATRISTFLFYKFKGRLSAVLEYIEVSTDLYKDFSKWYGKLNDKLTASKRRKNIKILPEIANEDIDSKFSVADSFWIKNNDKAIYDNFNSYEKALYRLERTFEEAGKAITRAQYLILVQGGEMRDFSQDDVNDYCRLSFSELDLAWYFAADDTALESLLYKTTGTGVITVMCINNTSSLGNASECAYKTGIGIISGFRFLGNYTPRKAILSDAEIDDILYQENVSVKPELRVTLRNEMKAEPLEFEKLAELTTTNEKLDYPLLGVLRLDVDNLGAAFIFGFKRESNGKNIFSLSRNVGLSRELNMFFCGFINVLAQKYKIYITYAGGDDLFVVGSWLNIIDFAFELRNQFDKMTGSNPNLTLSAGISISKSNYPVVKAARMAGEAEEKSKKFSPYTKPDGSPGKPTKNAITLFDRAGSWNDQEEFVKYGKEIASVISGDDSPDEQSQEQASVNNSSKRKKVNASFIHLLLSYTERMFDRKGNFNTNMYFGFLGKLRYLFARSPRNMNYKTLSNESSVREDVRVLGKLVYDQNAQKNLKNFKIPASYAILKNRKSKK